MDKHYLQPLLEPEAIVVFAARRSGPAQQTAQGRALTEAIRAQRFTGTIRFLEIGPLATDVWRFDFQALTAENTVLANTGSEVPMAAVLMLGTVAVLIGGLTVIVARRRETRIQ